MRRYKTNEESEIDIQEKLVINSLSDQIKISIDKIYNLNLYNFRGTYFKKQYKEAVESETLQETKDSSLNKTKEYSENLPIIKKLKIKIIILNKK